MNWSCVVCLPSPPLTLHRRLLHCCPAPIHSGTFTLYDHILDFSNTFNIIPAQYAKSGLNPLDTFFAMARGHQKNGVDLPATEMKKWFDSNYHYLVPEIHENVDFKLNNTKPVDDFLEAKQAGYNARPVLVGPVTLLWLGKVAKEANNPNLDLVSQVDKLAPVYVELLKKLSQAGAEWVQIDEPLLGLDVAQKYAGAFKSTYELFAKEVPQIKSLIATYFGRLDSNVKIVESLPVAGLHIDLDRAPKQVTDVVSALKSSDKLISLGLVSGRNIWKADLAANLKTAQDVVSQIGAERVQVATSSSLLHTPYTIKSENKLDAQTLDWFSFATEKCAEVATLAQALRDPSSAKAALDANAKSISARRDFEKKSDPAVRNRVSAIKQADLDRKSPFSVRSQKQRQRLNLPLFPTTTIGSFPQTKEIRASRARFNKGEISQADYDKFLENEIQDVVKRQEALGLDVLVHGEPERNDMVQYFGELLEGFAFTQNGWVQSFGSRYVRPPIVVSDVSRPTPMTVRWSTYAQSLTQKVMKGMLTGPVTILNWSFPRADISKYEQFKQIGLAIRDEVQDLAKANIVAIQIDEPALREGMPLRQSDWDEYLTEAVNAFKLSSAGVEDDISIHSHFCYSSFEEIIKHIYALDADMISIENSKSDAKLLKVFTGDEKSEGVNWMGPGIFDIHSPRVPTADDQYEKLSQIIKAIGKEKVWANPDCGLKTRTWAECTAQLQNMLEATERARKDHA